jgi:hypothetical protein
VGENSEIPECVSGDGVTSCAHDVWVSSLITDSLLHP